VIFIIKETANFTVNKTGEQKRSCIPPNDMPCGIWRICLDWWVHRSWSSLIQLQRWIWIRAYLPNF